MALYVRILSSILLFVTMGCDGPLPFMAGGRLDGRVATTPTEWAFDEDFDLAELESRPEDPYSVNVAYTQLGGRLYVNAGDTETEWVKHISANPLVRLRVSGVLYELRAERVTSPDEIAEFGEAWVSHSMIHRDPTALEEVWLYRLVPR